MGEMIPVEFESWADENIKHHTSQILFYFRLVLKERKQLFDERIKSLQFLSSRVVPNLPCDFVDEVAIVDLTLTSFRDYLNDVLDEIPLSCIEKITEMYVPALETIFCLLEAFNSCLNSICSRYTEAKMQNSTLVVIISRTVPQILFKGLTYCQSYTTCDMQILDILKSIITKLFQKYRDLLTILLQLVNNILIFKEEEQVQDASLHMLTKGTIELLNLTSALHFNSFVVVCRILTQLAAKYKKAYYEPSNVCKFFECLNVQSIKMISEFIEPNKSSVDFSQHLDKLFFLLKIIKQQGRLFGNCLTSIFPCLTKLLSLIGMIAVFNMPSYLEVSFINKLEYFVSSQCSVQLEYLIENSDFADLILLNAEGIYSQGDVLGFCYLLCHIIRSLPGQSSDCRCLWWRTEKCNILGCLLWHWRPTFSQMKSAPYWPGIQLEGCPVVAVNPYQYILTQTQGAISGANEQEIDIVQKVILQSILTSDNYWNVQLSVDLWCFISRFGTPALCASHTSLLCKILLNKRSKLPCLNIIMLKSLIRRLSHFLTPSDSDSLSGILADVLRVETHKDVVSCNSLLKTLEEIRNQILDAASNERNSNDSLPEVFDDLAVLFQKFLKKQNERKNES